MLVLDLNSGAVERGVCVDPRFHLREPAQQAQMAILRLLYNTFQHVEATEAKETAEVQLPLGA